MEVILFFLSAAGICVTVGGLGLHFENKKRLDELERSIGYLNSDKKDIAKRVTDLEEKKRHTADRIEIVHTYDDSGAPQFGGF